MGVFSSLDLVLFFLFWEIELIPMYFLISIWGSGNRVYSAWKYVLYTFFGSAFMMIGILVLGFTADTFDMRELAQIGRHPRRHRASLGDLRADHRRFPDQAAGRPVPYVAARRAYGRADGRERDPGRRAAEDGRLRHPAPLVQHHAGRRRRRRYLARDLAAVSILYGAVMTLMQTDLKRLIAYSCVSHMGYVLLGASAIGTSA